LVFLINIHGPSFPHLPKQRYSQPSDLGFFVRYFRDAVNGSFQENPAGALRVVRGPDFGALLEVGLEETFVSVFSPKFHVCNSYVQNSHQSG
jgi:hypothetical protein